MTPDKKIRLGIVGCGRVTETLHLPSLQRVPSAEVVALSDVSVQRLNRVADAFHIKSRHTSYQQLLEDASIDAVAVCVPAQSHVQVGLGALKAGKHLFIEKPLALRLDEADLLINFAKNSHLKAAVGFNLRRHRLIQGAHNMLQKGAFGRLRMIRTLLSGYHESVPEWRRRRELGGGVFFEQAVHHFDLWRFLLETEVDEVFALNQSGAWDDESAIVTARMANGMLACAVFSERAIARNEP